MLQEEWENQEGFTWVMQAKATEIQADRVIYLDAEHREHTVGADDVIIAAGMKARTDSALGFYGAADEFYMVGDCRAAGNVQKSIRSAFSTALMI
jgi:hypothetical protein